MNAKQHEAANTGPVGIRRLSHHLSPGQVLLGLDSGKKRWGLAISDDQLCLALPLLQYNRCGYTQDLALLAALSAERHVGGIVIGLPLHMNADLSKRSQAARQLGRDITAQLGLAVCYWDERLSSTAVERQMIEVGDVSRAKRQQSLDKLAASYILQGALDSLLHTSTSPEDT